MLRDIYRQDAMIVQVIDSYLEDGSQLLEASRIAANQGHALVLFKTAYTFKSSSARLGGLKLYELSQARKDMSKRGTVKAALKLVTQLEVEDNRVKVTLSTQRQRHQRNQG